MNGRARCCVVGHACDGAMAEDQDVCCMLYVMSCHVCGVVHPSIHPSTHTYNATTTTTTTKEENDRKGTTRRTRLVGWSVVDRSFAISLGAARRGIWNLPSRAATSCPNESSGPIKPLVSACGFAFRCCAFLLLLLLLPLFLNCQQTHVEVKTLVGRGTVVPFVWRSVVAQREPTAATATATTARRTWCGVCGSKVRWCDVTRQCSFS